MRVKSYVTNRDWLGANVTGQAGGAGGPSTDSASDEVSRVLSEIVTSRNLVVLAGLGTSLCVNAEQGTGAPTMERLWNAVRDDHMGAGVPGGEKSWDEVLRITRHPEDCSDIEELLSRAKMCAEFEDGDSLSKIRDFISRAEMTIRREVDFISPGTSLPSHEAFLRRLGRRSARRERLRLFTTNYDRCFEHAAQRAGFVVIDGFTFTQPPLFDPSLFTYDLVRRHGDGERPDYVESLFHLYKIHGSIDWEADQETRRVLKVSSTERPLLIYPRNSKYELAFEQPYLEMISSFQSCIRTRDTGLLVIGFGFNDSHIAEPVLAAIQTNLSLKTVVVSPSIMAEIHGNSYLKTISQLIDSGDPRLGLIEASFEELVPSMPDMAAMTDLERHRERIATIRRAQSGTPDIAV